MLGKFWKLVPRKMEKLIWTDRVRKEEVLHTVKEDRNILHTVKKIKFIWICHVLHMKRLLQHVIEEKIEGMKKVKGRWGKWSKLLLDALKEKRGNWKRKH